MTKNREGQTMEENKKNSELLKPDFSEAVNQLGDAANLPDNPNERAAYMMGLMMKLLML